jgi:hypothetical protein
VLLRPSSPAPWPVGPSHPCAKCGEFVPGLAIGGWCATCARDRARRASRVGRLVAAGTTLLVAAYVMLTLPPDRTARLVGAVSVLLWYVLTFLIARRVALEWLK